VAPGNASNTVQGPVSIVELAFALKENVDLIYEFCAQNIEFLPTYGLQKGGVGALADGFGNSFDQADLMVQLLIQAGYTADYLFGTIEPTAAAAGAWLGTDPTNAYASANLLANGGIPCVVNYNSMTGIYTVALSHCWVQVNISGTNYVFDPAMKSYTTSTGINLATALSYNATTFMTDATSGATITTDYAQNINRSNIFSDLKTLGMNLVTYLKTNSPGASLDDVLGGRVINPVTSGQRITSLPYQAVGTPTVWTAIPGTYKATMHIVYDSPNIDITFNSADVYGHRLTLGFNASDEAELRLDGTLLATSSVQSPGSWNSVLFDVEHPYGSTWANSWVWEIVWEGQYYYLANNWGNLGPQMIDTHGKALQVNRQAGLASTDEAVWGETCAVIGHTMAYESSSAADIVNRMSLCTTVWHHQCGLVGWFSTPLENMGAVTWSSSALDNDYTRVPWNDTTLAMFGVSTEAEVMDNIAGIGGISTTPLIDIASSAGNLIYKANTANWTGTVKPALVNYPSADLTYIETTYIDNGYDVILSQNGSITKGVWNGYGYWALPSQGAFGIISGALKGGGGDNYLSLVDEEDNTDNQITLQGHLEDDNGPINNQGAHGTTDGQGWQGAQGGGHDFGAGYPTGPTGADPIVLQSGAQTIDTTDLSIGSQGFPYGLEFGRSYRSDRRLENGPLGLGWMHSWLITANASCDYGSALGAKSPIMAAAAIAALFVAADILTDTTKPVEKIVTVSLLQEWFNEQRIQNSVLLRIGGAGFRFNTLPDGSYFPVTGDASTLTLASTYSYTTADGTVVNFDSSGNFSTIVLPYGMTVTATYTSGILQSVSNGLGRTLTLAYTGVNLTSVSDGTGRSVQYTVDTNDNLTQFTNAASKLTTYQYDLPGRLIKAFKPANPTVPTYTNTYDSLDRVKQQSNALGQVTNLYMAGYRSEHVDALTNSTVFYFNNTANCTKIVDALSQIREITYDGFQRRTALIAPEGNSIQIIYNVKGLPTTVTSIPKPGSGLANLVSNYTFDTTWNKVKTVQDPNLNTTTYNYDASTGRLLSISRPIVGGFTPQVVMTYNARGQQQSITDETGIVTQFSYDVSTEKLTSIIQDYGTGRLNLTTQFGYNSCGDVTSLTDPRGNATTFQFDAIRRMTQETEASPFAFVTNLTYTDNDKLATFQRQTGNPSSPWQAFSYGYSLTDKMTSVTDPQARVKSFSFDGLDRLWKITDALSRVTEFGYDAVSRLEAVTDPTLTVAETRTYSNNGLLASYTDSRTNTTTVTFDGHDRLDETIYADSTFIQNQSYDANGNVLVSLTRDGKTITSVYDVLNRRTSKTPQGQPTISYTWDLSGRLLTSSKPVVAGDPSSGTFTNYYDTAGRFYQEQYPNGNTFTHQLDANGNFTRTTWPDAWYVDRVYDALNRQTDIKLNGATTSAVQFQYDQLSRTQSIVFENGCNTNIELSLNDNTESFTHNFVGSSLNATFGFDNSGQLISQQMSDPQYTWHPTAAGTTSYGTAGNLNEYPTVGGVTQTYNNNGCLTGDGTWTFGYDVDNMLISAAKTGTTVAYSYDPIYRQVQKTVGSTSTLYYYAGIQRLADYSSAGALQNRYVYGNGLDEVLIQISSSGTKTYYHPNHQSSIIATTNSSGNVVSRYTYSPFGESSSLTNTMHGFTGQRFDSDSGLYYYKNRYYSPALGRFLQPDPIGLYAGANLYAYVSNNPLTRVDLLGLYLGVYNSESDAVNAMLAALAAAAAANPSIEHDAVIAQGQYNGQWYVSDILNGDGTTSDFNKAVTSLATQVPFLKPASDAGHTHTDNGSWWVASQADMNVANNNNIPEYYIGGPDHAVYKWQKGDQVTTQAVKNPQPGQSATANYGVGQQYGNVTNGKYVPFSSPKTLITPTGPAVPIGSNSTGGGGGGGDDPGETGTTS
jgi:RHS repeat-associated protein